MYDHGMIGPFEPAIKSRISYPKVHTRKVTSQTPSLVRVLDEERNAMSLCMSKCRMETCNMPSPCFVVETR